MYNILLSFKSSISITQNPKLWVATVPHTHTHPTLLSYLSYTQSIFTISSAGIMAKEYHTRVQTQLKLLKLQNVTVAPSTYLQKMAPFSLWNYAWSSSLGTYRVHQQCCPGGNRPGTPGGLRIFLLNHWQIQTKFSKKKKKKYFFENFVWIYQWFSQKIWGVSVRFPAGQHWWFTR